MFPVPRGRGKKINLLLTRKISSCMGHDPLPQARRVPFRFFSSELYLIKISRDTQISHFSQTRPFPSSLSILFRVKCTMMMRDVVEVHTCCYVALVGVAMVSVHHTLQPFFSFGLGFNPLFAALDRWTDRIIAQQRLSTGKADRQCVCARYICSPRPRPGPDLI